MIDILKKIRYNLDIKAIICFAALGLILLMNKFECPVYGIIGIPCPACGITRAYRLFFFGNIKEAFLMHPLFLLPAVFIFKPFQKKHFFAAVIVIFIVVYILRFRVLFPATEPFNYNYNSLIGEFLK